ncbi:AN1-type zinc finger protein 1 [Gorgonomyces haynaldii]|nr:AN1-type zinc finger protein 1 [Gorgonomyces haynaldii]
MSSARHSLMQIGQHCAESDCNQLDFLPFKCRECNKNYCPLHRFPDKHHCILKETKILGLDTNIGKQECALESCKTVDILLSQCRVCLKTYCLSHRHPPDHGCETKTVSKPKIEQKQIKQKKPLTPQVQLMKLKLSAQGDQGIPSQHRAYFLLMSSPEKQEKLFFDQRWTVGRLVDYLAKKYGILNTNNAQDLEKLGLYKHENGQRLPFSEHIESCFKSKLVNNGGILILLKSASDKIDTAEYEPNVV